MPSYWFGRAASSWTLRLALALVAIALLVGFLVAQQRNVDAARRSLAREGGGKRPAIEWSGPRGQARTLEIRLDELLGEIGDAGVSTLDRQAALTLTKRALRTDGDVESLRVGDVLQRMANVRILTEGRSIVLGPRAIRLLARLAVGRDAGSVDHLTVGEVLDALPAVSLNSDGTPRRLDLRSQRVVDAIFGGVRRVDTARGPGFEERLALERKYESVVELVDGLRRDGFGQNGDVDALYDEAYNRLLTSSQEDAIALLDGHLRLEDELDNANLRTFSLPERIQLRWEARRFAFGEETAEMIFGRREAMERYQVDKLALDADDAIAPAEKARRLAQREKALKVELAAMGSYVGFPGEASAVEPAPVPRSSGRGER